MKPLLPLALVAALLLPLAGAELTLTEIRAIDLSDAVEDNGWVAPVAKALDHLASDPQRAQEVAAFRTALPPSGEPLTWTFALLNASALIDLGRGSCEAEANYTVFALLAADPRREEILRAAGTIALGRDGLTAVQSLPALNVSTTTPPAEIHDRISLLARKLVGRLLGTLPRP